jgi:hypothetical protein
MQREVNREKMLSHDIDQVTSEKGNKEEKFKQK